MEATDFQSIKIFAEYLSNLRAVNLYVTLESSNSFLKANVTPPHLSVANNAIQIPRLGSFTVVINNLNIEDSNELPPRTLDNNILCYRLVVKPEPNCGSAAAEIISNFTKTVDDGAKNLVRNSLNNVAIIEGTYYQLKCRFCSNLLGDNIKFDRVRPLPSKNWVENAHELWYCHPPEPTSSQGLHQDVSARLSKVNIQNTGQQNKSIVELLSNPDVNYCFYGPCNWAVNKDIVKGICKNESADNLPVVRADCSSCASELGSFTSEHCVRIWDFGVEWVSVGGGGGGSSESKVSSTSQTVSPEELTKARAFQNFKSIVFATIYELSDHPTFRFTVSSIYKGNSVFLWNIDRNLAIYEQKSVNSNSSESVQLDKVKVAKFFFAVRENNQLSVSDAREVLIIQESEQNDQSILTIPDFVYKTGVEKLRETSVMYARNEQALQCGFLPYDV